MDIEVAVIVDIVAVFVDIEVTVIDVSGRY